MFLIAGIVCWIRGNVTARFYTLAWAVYIIGGTSATLRNTGVLNYNFWSTHLFEIGAASETFLLAFALSDRYRRFKKEKEEAIQDLLRAEKEANETLEQKVKERTQEIQAALHTIQEQNDELTVLNEETRQQSEEITAQRDALAGANQEIRKQNQDIIASITYARRIQTALLPSKERIKAYLPDLLLFYQPKDIVSGDFYWFAEGKDTVFLAVADCTGHGVPGALMTVIGESLLDHIINIDKIHSPAKILTELDKRLLKTLRQQGIEAEKVQDGMDIALLRIDTKNKQILWAGAMRPIWIFNPDYPEPTIHKGNKFPIGSNQFKQKSYAEQSISLQMGDTIYAFTDGYADQFGVQGKFNIKQFRTWLTAHFQKPFEEQHQLLHDTFHAWKGIERQTDDVLVLGFRV
jgi:serine phosphatase RsbU (regulator of sigma subunit)